MTSLADNDEHIPAEVRERCLNYCRRFLGGSWARATQSDFQIRQIKGGLSNLLFCCQLSDDLSLIGNEPRCALVRFYGQIIRDNRDNVLTDSVVFGLLAAKKIGPDIYGIFMDGRLEEFIPSRHLRTKELHDPAISEACARIMAQFHSLRMPIDKDPKWMTDVIKGYTKEGVERLASDQTKDPRLDRLRSIDLIQELNSLISTLEKVNSPVVFCHNDFQEGNILYVRTPTGWHLRPIDFEYASYNYRGYDIANHLCEWCFDYNRDEPPYFKGRLQDFPNREQQLRFVRAYLRAMNKERVKADSSCGLNNNDRCSLIESSAAADEGPIVQQCSDDDDDDVEEKNILLEISTFAMASHFSSVGWSIVQHYVSDIQFGYLDFAITRLNAYFHQKQLVYQQLVNKRLLGSVELSELGKDSIAK